MTARGRRFLARLVTTLVAGLAGILAVGALPAAADTVGIGQYVALGDSYAAGQGASAPEDYHNKCLRSPNGYPALLDAENQIHLRANAACTGATTSAVANEQLSALKQGTRLVTLTVGAADLGLSQVLTACTRGGLRAARGDLTRPVLEHYSLPFLDQMVSLVTTGTVISYAIYTVNSPQIGSKMMLTIPPVIYGIFRYLYLIYDRSDDRSMAQIVAGDRGIQAAGASYALVAFLLLYVFN